LHYLSQQQANFALELLSIEQGSLEELVGRYLHLYQRKALNEESKADHLSEQELRAAYQEYFNERPQRKQELSFSSLSIFIRVMEILIKRFKDCPFSSEVIQDMISEVRDIQFEFHQQADIQTLAEVYSSLRQDIFSGLLQTAEEMTTKCVSSVAPFCNAVCTSSAAKRNNQ